MKRICSVFLMITFLLCGCTGYERDTSAGEIKLISLSDMETMMKEQKEFVIVFTQSTCGYCAEFHEMFESYRKNHHVVIYEVPLDEEKELPSVNRALIQTYFPNFDSTPGIFYAKDGKCINGINQSQKLNEELFDNWVQKYKLDKKE